MRAAQGAPHLAYSMRSRENDCSPVRDFHAMAKLALQTESLSSIQSAVAAILGGAPMSPGSSANAYFDSFAFGSQTILLNGTGLSFNANGVLNGGTITGLSEFDNTAANFSLSNVQLGFSDFAALASNIASFGQTALAGDDTITLTNNPIVVGGYAGNDIFVVGASPVLAAGITSSAILDGGAGSNTVDLLTLRSDSAIAPIQSSGTTVPDAFQITASGGSYTTANVTATNVSTLQFLDGATYADGSSIGGQVAIMFAALLGRSPEATGLGFYVNYAGTAGTTATGDAIIGTAEGQTDTAGLSNSAFVSRMYLSALGRAPDAAGQAFWQGGLDSGTLTRGNVAAGIAASAEALGDSSTTLGATPLFGASPTATLVDQIYQVLTAALPTDALLQSGITSLTGGATADQLATSIIGSSAYATQYGTQTAASFVNTLQTNVFGAADANATAYWASAINNGSVTQGQVALAYAQSPGELAHVATLASATGVVHS